MLCLECKDVHEAFCDCRFVKKSVHSHSDLCLDCEGVHEVFDDWRFVIRGTHSNTAFSVLNVKAFMKCSVNGCSRSEECTLTLCALS